MKDNLFRCRIIPYDSWLCVSGCGNLEPAHHMFFSCDLFGSLWHLVRKWLGIPLVDLQVFPIISFNVAI